MTHQTEKMSDDLRKQLSKLTGSELMLCEESWEWLEGERGCLTYLSDPMYLPPATPQLLWVWPSPRARGTSDSNS